MPAPSLAVFGNLTRDPELRYTASGTAWVTFTVANTKWKKNDNDEWVENGTSFYDCKLFGEASDRITDSFVKGDRLIVLGRLEQESWEKDGEKRSKMVVIADEVGGSTKNATVTVQRVTRTEGGTSTSTSGDTDPF